MTKNNKDISEMHFIPVGERVVVLPFEQETKTQSGIIIPDSPVSEKPQEGTIIALGASKKDDSILNDLEVGHKVLFKKYANDEVEVGGKTYLVMEADSVLAILK